MLVLITYDVNTETAAGKSTLAKGGKAMCKLWTACAKFCI